MKHLISVILTIAFSLGCSTAAKRDYRFLELPKSINKDAQKILTVAQVKYDTEQTLFALDTAYSGKQFLPAGEYPKLVENIKSIPGPLSAEAFCEKMDQFMDAVSDNHLAAKFNDKTCFKNPAARKAAVGANFYSASSEIPWQTKLVKKGQIRALLISITSFRSSTSPVWNGFLESVKENLSSAQMIVLDIRGNGGGDDSKGLELATLLAGAELKKPYAKQWRNTSPEAHQIFANAFEYFIRQDQEDGKEPAPYLVALRQEYIGLRDQALSQQSSDLHTPQTTGSDFDLKKSVGKPIYILIDAGCASSCESTTDFFEYNPLVKTVGENTAGFVHFGNNGAVILKNSGIRLQIATNYNSYLDGRFIEKTGIRPKIVVPAGEDALEYAWKDMLRNRKLDPSRD